MPRARLVLRTPPRTVHYAPWESSVPPELVTVTVSAVDMVEVTAIVTARLTVTADAATMTVDLPELTANVTAPLTVTLDVAYLTATATVALALVLSQLAPRTLAPLPALRSPPRTVRCVLLADNACTPLPKSRTPF